jgi:hypothetical protein
MCRFSDAGNDKTIHALLRPASEKRQGTKSRNVGPAVQRALWGFSHESWRVELGLKRLPRMACGKVWSYALV